MEKSRAIELLKLAVPIKALTQQECSDFVEAVNMGMDALEQPTSPDTIDRKAALDALRKCQTYLYDARDPELKIELSSAEEAINNLSTIQPVATDIYVGDTISKFIDGLEEIFADIRERHVDDSVCGLCEYDGAYIGQSGNWYNECPGFDRDDCFKLSDKTRKKWTDEIIKALPSAQPEPLTDKEQRIFLAAMKREEKVCKQVDGLVRVCHEIKRKVKGALWTI
jgi:hypothetical protein